jgi:Tfp pilus assembly protein PilO
VTRGWAIQNRNWLFSLMGLVTIVAVIILGASTIGVNALTYWAGQISREKLDLMTLDSSLRQERNLEEALSSRIKFLSEQIEPLPRQDESLQQLRRLAAQSDITLTSFDQQESAASSHSRSIRLLAEGKYDALGNFVASVEKRPAGLTIVDLELSARNRTKGMLNAVVVLLDKTE